MLITLPLYYIFPLNHTKIYKIKIIPRIHAKEVDEYARATLDKDKAGRRRLYEKLVLLLDDLVK